MRRGATKNLIKKVLKHRLKKGDHIHLVSGGCPKGADRFAEELAKELELGISIHYPKTWPGMERWEFAKEAFARNTLIAEECDVLLSLPSYDSKGFPIGGTADTIKKGSTTREACGIIVA